jgi:hypothetical protein
MSERDDTSRNRVATFKTSGVGVNITQNCDFCLKPRNQLGGKRTRRGPMWLFKCAICRQAEDQK